MIANPEAGHGKGTRSIKRLKGLLRDQNLNYQFFETTAPGEATEIARRLAETGRDRIIVLGGDGTISEVVNGVFGSDVELGVISVGTGNDVARSLGLPHNNLEASLKIVLTGNPREIDVGEEAGRYFISVLGVGFAATVAAETNKMKLLKGSTAFFAAVYKAIGRLRSFPLCLTLDSQKMEVECIAVLIQNTRYSGGGLLLAPEAAMDDGLFDVVVVEKMSRMDLMLNFPRLYKGSHLDHPKFSVHQARFVEIESPVALEKMFDGDIFGKTPVRAKVVERAVRVVG